MAPLRVAAATAEAAISTASPPTASPASLVAGAISDGPRSTALSYGDRTRKRVALTFDAGADVGYAADILDTLDHEHAIASFGMTGTWAEQNPQLVKRMAAEGHQLINHTWSHASFTGLSTGAAPLTRAQRWAEIDRTEAAIQRIAGVSTLPYFRPPYGDMDASVLADVGARGYTVTAMWAVDSLGWNGLSAPRIVERTLALTSPGAILIFHVGAQSQDAAALPAIIDGLRANGYDFVSLAALTNG
ncbi:MAG: polysaccharide deacetylase family protein [Dehalococcoidia bacterium]